nr:hypothetical protein [Cellvibrionaceae bacterium]
MKFDRYSWIDSTSQCNISLPVRTAAMMFCITLYSEEYTSLNATLLSIKDSLKAYFTKNKALLQPIKLCIICDGLQHLSTSVKEHIYHQQWIDARVETAASENGIHVFQTRGIFSEDKTSTTPRQDNAAINIYTEIIIKPKNKGKLDSHWWFFNKLCKSHNPKYGFQVDTGTLLKPAALSEMIGTFRENPHAAAVASNVLIEPKEPAGLLQQF